MHASVWLPWNFDVCCIRWLTAQWIIAVLLLFPLYFWMGGSTLGQLAFLKAERFIELEQQHIFLSLLTWQRLTRNARCSLKSIFHGRSSLVHCAALMLLWWHWVKFVSLQTSMLCCCQTCSSCYKRKIRSLCLLLWWVLYKHWWVMTNYSKVLVQFFYLGRRHV